MEVLVALILDAVLFIMRLAAAVLVVTQVRVVKVAVMVQAQ